MKTSIRLFPTALAVSGISFAASGKPLASLATAQPAMAVPLPSVDGQAPGEILAQARANLPGARSLHH